MSNILPTLAEGYRWKVKPSSTTAKSACVLIKLQRRRGGLWWTVHQKWAFDTSYQRFESSIPEVCNKIMRESGYSAKQRAREFAT
jgi:hypothetical protein